MSLYVIWKPFYLASCLTYFKPIVYRQLLDNAILLFRSKDHIDKFRNYLNKQHKSTKSKLEIKKTDLLSLLDIKMSRENDKIVTSVYHNPAYSHRKFILYSNYENFH